MDGFVLSRPDHSVVTRGVQRSFDSSDAATHALSAGTTKLIVGALPFDPAAATALYEPAEATIGVAAVATARSPGPAHDPG